MDVPELPELVRLRAQANGEAGREWVASLPALVAGLADRWGLRLGDAMAGGTASLVLTADREDGTPCVLKVAMPLEDGAESFRRAVLAHGLAGGEGCAALLAHDPSVAAMLVERLGPDLHSLDLPIPDVLDAVADTLVAFWRPVPPGTELPSGADQAGWLASYITSTWAELGEPCPRAVVDRAVALCERRIGAFDPDGAVLVHGDAHGWNTLRTDDGSCKFVDPEGLISSRAHDLAIPMREYNLPFLDGDTPVLVRARAEHLAARCGDDIDPDDVWEWGYIERVSTGLANISQLAGSGGEAFLEVAERCL